MNKSLIFVLGVGLAIILALVFAFTKIPQAETDWNTNFEERNKSPFGFYILRNELKLITNSDVVLELEHIYDLDTIQDPENYAIIFLNQNFENYNNLSYQIKDFIDYGGTLFMSYNNNKRQIFNSDRKIIHRLKYDTFEFESNYNQYTNNVYAIDSISESEYIIDEYEDSIFVKYEVLGTVSINNQTKINYTKTTINDGYIFTHYDPILFTNFYLLDKEGLAYTKKTFRILNGKKIIWVNPFFNMQTNTKPSNNSSLRFILNNPELKTAWYILLLCLFLYFIFKSKRLQQYIPIQEPEKNMSLEYAHVIASMYYESGKPHDIIKKKVDYFYYTIRKQFNLISSDTTDEHFHFILAQKAQISKEEIKTLLAEINQIYTNKAATLADVNRIYHLIEFYKTKANLK